MGVSERIKKREKELRRLQKLLKKVKASPSLFDYGPAIQIFAAALTGLGDHIADHRVYEGWEENVADIRKAVGMLDGSVEVEAPAGGGDDAERNRLKAAFSFIGDHIMAWWD